MQKRVIPLLCGTALALILPLLTSGMVRAEELQAPSPTEQNQTAEQQVAADKQTADGPVTEVEVRANRDKRSTIKEGRSEAGYKADNTTTTGPWGKRKLLDTPYSINIMSSELIENLQASSVDTLYGVNPMIQAWTVSTRGAGGNANMLLRGFSAANASARAEDGIHTQLLTVNLEDKDRGEILTGLSGFLYGPANVGGMINYVNKRPTATPLANLTVGNYGGSSYYAHADLGGPMGRDGKLAYRLNILTQDGDTAVDHQSLNRKLVSGAMDWHLSDKAVIQFNAAHEESTTKGTDAVWSFATNADGSAKAFHNVVPNPVKNWGQPFAVSKMVTDKFGLGLNWQLNEIFTLRSAFRYADDVQKPGIYVNNNVNANTGTYSQTINYSPEYQYTSRGGYAFLDGLFKTGRINHKVTFGYFGDRLDKRQLLGTSYKSTTLTNLNFGDPSYILPPSFNVTNTGSTNTVSISKNQNIVLGDDIKFNERWAALVGFNHAEIIAKNYSTSTGVLSSQYDKSANTPTASLIYKPVSWFSTYATYMKSLEQGAIVPTTGLVYTNAGQVLEPLVSKQYELGAKATVGGTLLTAALFQIDRASQYGVNNGDGTYTYVQNGREVHKGIEFTVSGKVTNRLTLVGGLTLMDCEITNNKSTPALVGKRPQNVANQMIKLYAEYDLPSVPGMTLIGGVYYTGSFYADAMNTDKIPGVVIGDLGVRYQTTIQGTPIIYRLNVTNVTNKHYWLNSMYVGAPRRVTLSMEMKL